MNYSGTNAGSPSVGIPSVLSASVPAAYRPAVSSLLPTLSAGALAGRGPPLSNAASLGLSAAPRKNPFLLSEKPAPARDSAPAAPLSGALKSHTLDAVLDGALYNPAANAASASAKTGSVAPAAELALSQTARETAVMSQIQSLPAGSRMAASSAFANYMQSKGMFELYAGQSSDPRVSALLGQQREAQLGALETSVGFALSGAEQDKASANLKYISAKNDPDAYLLEGAKTDGKYWGTQFAADPGTMEQVNRSLRKRSEFLDMADRAAEKGDYSSAEAYVQSAQSALEAAMSARNLAGRVEHRTGFMGMFIQSADGVTTKKHFDWTGLAALSAIVLPVLSTVYTTESQRQSDKMMLDWKEEENDKDRQNALDQIRMRGEYEAAVAQIGADAQVASSGHAPIGQSASISLGGSFSAG